MNIQNNKIIAEFMGISNIEKDIYSHTNEKGENVYQSYYRYDTEWNWLMEVVEKIESLEFYPKNSTCIGFDTFGVEINKKRCDITRYGDFTNNLIQSNGKTRIETVYNACIEFIKWYNEQNQ